MNSIKYSLEISHLKKSYRKHLALKDLSLKVPSGAVMGLIGPNGAGKTTAFAIIAGLLRSDGGEINVLGQGKYDPVKHKGKLTLLPQDAMIPGHSRVRETLIYFGRLQGLEKRTAQYDADKTLEWVNLKDRANSSLSTLSHGMIRRLAVAQAFIGEPELVLLDEPTSGLDPQQVVNVRDLIMSRRHKQTIIISSHILSEIEAACDQIAFIDEGVTTRQDAMDNIVQRSSSLSIILTESLEMIPDELKQRIPEATFSLEEKGKLLSVAFKKDNSPSTMNRILIPELFNLDINIEEIRRGGDLEKIYLEDRLNNHKK